MKEPAWGSLLPRHWWKEWAAGLVWKRSQIRRLSWSLRCFRSLQPKGLPGKIAVPASARLPQAVAAGMRVLLVEDSPENAILMRAYLDNLALSLELAGNGAVALAKRQQRDYDLVLMDIQMAVMDGYTATREIRSWEKAHGWQRVPVVALTAHAANEAGAESLARAATAILRSRWNAKTWSKPSPVRPAARDSKRACPGGDPIAPPHFSAQLLAGPAENAGSFSRVGLLRASKNRTRLPGHRRTERFSRNRQ